MPRVDDVLDEAERLLMASDAVEHPHAGKELADAEELLTYALGVDEPNGEDDVPPPALRRFRRLLARRAAGEPPAYLTGQTDFFGLSLEVGRGAFIPRESSEFMVVQAVRRLRRRPLPVHVDMATGVGPVALAVAHSLPEARVFGVDLHARPIELARRNAGRLGLGNTTFLRGDLFAPLPRGLAGGVDTISIHPPYVGRREMRELPKEILDHEPRESLTDESPAGTGLLTRVVADAPVWLRPGGWLMVEVSPDRSRAVSSLLRRGGFRDVRSTKGGVEVSRVVVGRVR
jgi:release factor glutamine methyltransferase